MRVDQPVTGKLYTSKAWRFHPADRYYPHQVKKRLIYAFAPGSCFKVPFAGDIYDVSHEGGHPVYRCLKPMFMEVII